MGTACGSVRFPHNQMLAGPTLTKIALTAAGEIRPEGRTSARVENKPEEVA